MRLREHPGIGEGRTDILPCDPRQLSVQDGYNVRDLTTPEARAELDDLKALVKQHGVRTPLVVRFDGATIWIVEGHRRHKVALELIAEFEASGGTEGRNIDFVPITAEKLGTSDIDRDFGLETSNSGSRLKPLELANLIFRLHTQRGLPLEAIAEGLGKSLPVIKNTLALRAMPEEVKEHVKAGDISATLAGKISKNVDPKVAVQRLRENLEENRRITGTKKRRTKVTPRSLKRNEAKAEPPKTEPKAGITPQTALVDELHETVPAPIMAPNAEIEPHEPHPQLQAAAERENGHGEQRRDAVVTFPPSADHDFHKELFRIVGCLAQFAEGFDLNSPDSGETLTCEFPLAILRAADRVYRARIGDTTADEAA
jgi:ParB-like chromosome segregation protein Spo0J